GLYSDRDTKRGAAMRPTPSPDHPDVSDPWSRTSIRHSVLTNALWTTPIPLSRARAGHRPQPQRSCRASQGDLARGTQPVHALGKTGAGRDDAGHIGRAAHSSPSGGADDGEEPP